jgi:2-dehydro-3-deoxygalactonokinase
MIAAIWGSTSFRAYKVDSEGNVEAERASARGAVTVPAGGFEEALKQEVGDWIHAGNGRVLLCGMAGARRGWKEAPYVAVPADFDRLVESVVRVEAEGMDARIVPGMMAADENGVPEVLRGEETEIFGCTGEIEKFERVCLPGLHSKWVRMEGGQIRGFSTSMSGDLFKAIRSGTILNACTRHEPDDDDAFLMGVERAKQTGGLAHHLFGVRTLVLTGSMKDTAASSFLHGLLIGHEIRAEAREGEMVHLIGDAKLCAHYEMALLAMEIGSTIEPEGTALRGLKRIAARLQW